MGVRPSHGITSGGLIHMTDPSRSEIADLEHQLMNAHDRILGLRAENDRLREQLAFFRDQPIEAAYTRIEELEDQREGLINTVAYLHDRIEEVAEEMRASRTWRVGRLVLSPLSVARRIRRPR